MENLKEGTFVSPNKQARCAGSLSLTMRNVIVIFRTSSDLQEKWETLSARVRCTAATIRIRLLEAGLKSRKVRKRHVQP